MVVAWWFEPIVSVCPGSTVLHESVLYVSPLNVQNCVFGSQRGIRFQNMRPCCNCNCKCNCDCKCDCSCRQASHAATMHGSEDGGDGSCHEGECMMLLYVLIGE